MMNKKSVKIFLIKIGDLVGLYNVLYYIKLYYVTCIILYYIAYYVICIIFIICIILYALMDDSVVDHFYSKIAVQ